MCYILVYTLSFSPPFTILLVLYIKVKKLLTEDNVNCRDEYGRNSTPLHLAG